MMGIFRRNPAAKHVGLEEMSSLIDGSISSETRFSYESHFQNCLSCKDEFLGMQETVFLLKKLPMVQPERSFLLTERETQESSWSLNNLLSIRRVGMAMALVAMLLFAGDLTGFAGSSNDSSSLQVGSKTLPSLIRISGESGPESTLSLTSNEKSNELAGYSETFLEESIPVNSTDPQNVSVDSQTKLELWYLQIGLFAFGIILFLLGSIKARRSFF